MPYSVEQITSIAAAHCLTQSVGCTIIMDVSWYSTVVIQISIVATWGDQVVYLNLRPGGSPFPPEGEYRCEIPDASGEMKNIYILIANLFI